MKNIKGSALMLLISYNKREEREREKMEKNKNEQGGDDGRKNIEMTDRQTVRERKCMVGADSKTMSSANMA